MITNFVYFCKYIFEAILKSLKNKLDGTLWRIEATISIPNYNCLALPINEFIEIINLANGSYLVHNSDKLKLHFKGLENGR